jgi:hypothetical protein
MLVTIYSKPDCHLCTDLKAELLHLQQEIGFTLIERNIEDSPEEFARFRYLIPVVDIAGSVTLYPPHTEYDVRQALLAARSTQESPNAHVH